MAHSHCVLWNNQKIENEIRRVMDKAKIDTMPTHTLMDKTTENTALSNAVSKHGGSEYWAKKLGLEIKSCESKIGQEFELRCVQFLTSMYGYDCELTPSRYPYDILVNSNIKIDVKIGNLYQGQGSYYTFNLGKSKPTCDVYVCYCVQGDNIQKIYVIPSCVLSGKTQLAIGEHRSKYDKYIDGWDILKNYDAFYYCVSNDTL